MLTHRNRLCVGACNDGRHKLDHWRSASMGDSRCWSHVFTHRNRSWCCMRDGRCWSHVLIHKSRRCGLHNGTRSVMALVRLSLSQSKVRFVSAALNTFLNIIVTS